MSKSASNYTILLVDMTKLSDVQVMDLVNASSTVMYQKYDPDNLEIGDELEQAYKDHEKFLEEIEETDYFMEMGVEGV